MALHILRNSVAFVDGNRIPETVDIKLPEIKLKSEKLWFGGADGEVEVDFGIQAMEASMKLGAISPAVMALVAFAPGKHYAISFNGAAVSEVDGTTIGIQGRFVGKIRDDSPGNWKHGDKSEFDYKFMVHTYKLTVASKVMYDIAPLSYIRIINGVDVLADMRAAMLI